MTLALAIPSKEGIIVASDSQQTNGTVRSKTQKIYALNNRTLWAASGEVAFIQRFSEQISLLTNKTQTLYSLRDTISQLIKQTQTVLLQNDFRTQFFSNSPDSLLSLHYSDLIFCEYFIDQQGNSCTFLLHVTPNGTTEWVNKPFATGNGSDFAYALLTKYNDCELTLDQAKVLATKVLMEAIEVSSFGLGYPIDIWEISKSGVRQILPNEGVALIDSARLLQAEEVNLLLRANQIQQQEDEPNNLLTNELQNDDLVVDEECKNKKGQKSSKKAS